MLYTVNYSAFLASGKYPSEALRPRSSGFDAVVFEAGDYSGVPFNPTEAAVFDGNGSTFGNITLQSLAGFELNNATVKGQSQIRSSSGVVNKCRFSLATASPCRIRYGSTVEVFDCEFRRRPPFPTGDVVAIYTSDGVNKVQIIGNEIWNYTDGVQFGFRVATDYGLNAGSSIMGNVIGISRECLNDDGTMMQGLENALDFKSGGTADLPVYVDSNVFLNYRPAILNGAGTPGYAVTFHNCARHFRFFGNRFIDCEAGYFLNAQYENGAWAKPHLYVEGDIHSGTMNHGAMTPWPMKQGTVVCGSNTAEFHRLVVDCERLEEMAPNAAAGPRVFTDLIEL